MAAAEYALPKGWTWNTPNGGQFASINRPIAGATREKTLPVGPHPLQLSPLGTPNGVKVTILPEELLAPGHSGAEYDAGLIRMSDGDQFGGGFVARNPNSRIPALLGRRRRGLRVDRIDGEPSERPHERHDARNVDTKTRDKIPAG